MTRTVLHKRDLYPYKKVCPTFCYALDNNHMINDHDQRSVKWMQHAMNIFLVLYLITFQVLILYIYKVMLYRLLKNMSVTST